MKKNLIELPKVLPDFFTEPNDFVEQVKKQRDNILLLVDKLTSGGVEPTWENVQEPLEKALSDLCVYSKAFSHRSKVLPDEKVKKTWDIIEPMLVELGNTLNQHKGMFATFTTIRNSTEFDSFSRAKKKVILNILRDAHLFGTDLSSEDQKKFKELSKELATVKNQFDNNLTDATAGCVKHITDRDSLDGLPLADIEKAAAKALEMGKTGWVFTINQSDYLSIITYADNRTFREEMYMEFQTRASDQGANAYKFDNTNLMDKVLFLSFSVANMLEYKNAAEYSLVTKSAETTDDVVNFLTDLAEKARPKAEAEKLKIIEYAEKDGITEIMGWDKYYYLEKIRRDEYSFSESEVKEYFSVDKVLKGMFAIVDKLYGITLIDCSEDLQLYRPEVKYYNVYYNNVLVGGIYIWICMKELGNGVVHGWRIW